jgi:Holliday junction resolvase RusA-like endonuclease
MLLTMTVPGLVRAKGRHRTRLNGHSYPDPKTANYEAKLATIAQKAMENFNQNLIDEPCVLIIDVYLQIPQNPKGGKKALQAMLDGDIRPGKKPDADNFLKIVGDGLNGIVWRDDSLIVTAVVRKWWSKYPRLHIAVSSPSTSTLVEESNEGQSYV